ncbi:MAG: MBOAT family protein [Tannerellaceae bacterium]|jgi:D-alanyl-lipoteichoic acid acyltransferase DltB (MBOAT superfamily)|nr:MBOAT family protein [Tannerellaceae bacterium]
MSRIIEQLTYDPGAPMLFGSGLFLFVFTAFLVVYLLLRKNTTGRLLYVAAFSLYFYYKSSGLWFALLLITATSDFIIGGRMHRTASVAARKALVVLSLAVNLGMLAYFKYYNFLVDMICGLIGEAGRLLGVESLANLAPLHYDIFLPVGVSFFTFQSISYILDLYRRRIEPVGKWIDYLFFVSFFPQLVAGPIIRARDFIPQIRRRPEVSREEFGEGLFLVVCGLLKKGVISDYISLNFVDRIFDAPTLYTGLENLIGVYGYALQIYCDFSGYSDMAIGIALLLGFRFNINFDSPYCSATITEFWRRWHISLSSWLKDYLYISLGGNRRGRIRTYVNLMITMLLGGLWHGASFRFILWGGLHGVSLAVHKWAMSRFPRAFKADGAQMPLWRKLAGILLTFHLVCLGWIFFRAPSASIGFDVLKQIFTAFHPEVFLQFVGGYPTVSLLMLAGFLFHFMPRRLDLGLRSIVTRSPLIVQALILVAVIFILVQMKSAGVQPFIYFQF